MLQIIVSDFIQSLQYTHTKNKHHYSVIASLLIHYLELFFF